MQNLPLARHGAQQGRKPALLRHVQLMRQQAQRHRHQDGLFRPDREAEEAAGLVGGGGGDDDFPLDILSRLFSFLSSFLSARKSIQIQSNPIQFNSNEMK